MKEESRQEYGSRCSVGAQAQNGNNGPRVANNVSGQKKKREKFPRNGEKSRSKITGLYAHLPFNLHMHAGNWANLEVRCLSTTTAESCRGDTPQLVSTPCNGPHMLCPSYPRRNARLQVGQLLHDPLYSSTSEVPIR